jgi:hypothetical protein
MADERPIHAVVGNIINGKHGKYVVAHPVSSSGIEGSITFDLEAYTEREIVEGVIAEAASAAVEALKSLGLSYKLTGHHPPPQKGEIVVLSNLRKKRNGWKAMSVRPLRPSDEVATSTERSLKDEDYRNYRGKEQAQR